jgi:hypothetical protein
LRKLSVALFFLALVVAVSSRAWALQSTLSYKQITVNITITPSPSPTPVSYVPAPTLPTAVADYLEPADPLMRALAFVPLRTDDMIAQAAPPEGDVKVNFTVKADPNAKYFHIVPVDTNLTAGYGPNTFTCVYQVFATYTVAWEVTDWVYGSSSTGGIAGLNGFPTYNYSTASLLQWKAEGITSSFKAFANDGSPGEATFSGLAKASTTACIDLSLNVPASIPAGTYQATLQYQIIVGV